MSRQIISSTWAAGVADAHLARESAATEQQRKATAIREECDHAVTTEGPAFLDRVEGAMGSAATLFNERVGRHVLDVHRSPSGALSIRSRDDGGYVLIAPDLQTGPEARPGLTVTVRQYGRGSGDFYDFVARNGRLHVERCGDVDSAEAFTRKALEPWLIGLPLEGR